MILALNSIVIGRLLGPDSYGLYSIALVIPTYLLFAIRLGLDSAALRYAALYRAEGLFEKAATFLRSVLFFEILLALGSIALITPFLGAISDDLLHRPQLASIIMPIAIFSVLGQSIYAITTDSFVSLDKFDRCALVMVLMSAARLLASTLLVVLGFAVLGAVLGYTIAYTVAAFVSVGMLMVMTRRRVPAQFRSDIKIALGYSGPVYIALILSGIIAPFQTTLLAGSVSDSAIGGFAAASAVTSAVTLSLSYPITTTLLPLFSKVLSDREKLAGMYRTTCKLSTLFVVPVTLFMMAFSNPLVTLVYGSAYSFSSLYLTLLISASLLAGFGGIAWIAFLNGIGETKRSLLAGGVGSIASLAGSAVSIPYFGVYGAIFSFIGGQIISLALATRIIASRFGWKNLNMFGSSKIYLASALATIVVFPFSLVPLHPIVVVFAGAFIFVAILIPILAITRALTRADMVELQEYFSGIRLLSFPLRLFAKYHGIFSKS